MKYCKYVKRYSRTNKHITCTKDGSLRRKGCWLNCPHVADPWWKSSIFKESLGAAIVVVLGVILMCCIYAAIFLAIRW